MHDRRLADLLDLAVRHLGRGRDEPAVRIRLAEAVERLDRHGGRVRVHWRGVAPTATERAALDLSALQLNLAPVDHLILATAGGRAQTGGTHARH